MSKEEEEEEGKERLPGGPRSHTLVSKRLNPVFFYPLILKHVPRFPSFLCKRKPLWVTQSPLYLRASYWWHRYFGIKEPLLFPKNPCPRTLLYPRANLEDEIYFKGGRICNIPNSGNQINLVLPDPKFQNQQKLLKCFANDCVFLPIAMSELV